MSFEPSPVVAAGMMSEPSRWSARWLGVVALFLTLLGGCAHYQPNAPIPAGSSGAPYLESSLHDPQTSSNLVVMLAFSGGGTRAAAFSFGVLEELRRTTIHWEGRDRRLLDEVDVISAVSGGSFPAAYYCLNRERAFEDFDAAFLKRNVQGALLTRLIAPRNCCRLWSPHFNRSDMAAEYYDKVLFHGATYGTLAEKGLPPYLLINVTDLTLGLSFPCTQRSFDAIGSDLRSLSLARAVAASSAVPGLLAPITLKNYGPTEHSLDPHSTLTGPRTSPFEVYSDLTNNAYIHLVDGGVADNLGLRPLLAEVRERGDPFARLRPEDPPMRVLIIVANSEVRPPRAWGRHERPPGILESLLGFSMTVMDRYSSDTVSLFAIMVEQWAFEAKRRNVDVVFYPVELKFDDLPTKEERDYFHRVPTSFRLSSMRVDRLRDAAGRLLRQAPDFVRFRRDMVSPSATASTP